MSTFTCIVSVHVLYCIILYCARAKCDMLQYSCCCFYLPFACRLQYAMQACFIRLLLYTCTYYIVYVMYLFVNAEFINSRLMIIINTVRPQYSAVECSTVCTNMVLLNLFIQYDCIDLSRTSMVLLPIAVHYRYGIHMLRAATYISHHRHFVRIQQN